MSSLAPSLRPHAAHSPTSSASSQNTTPTSPHFHHRHPAHPYAHSSEPRHQASSLSLSSTTIQHPRPATPPLFHPPAHQSLSTYLRTWGPNEIATFLGLYKCGHYAAVFRQNDIDGRVLLDLDMATLKEMGVAKVGERVKLLAGIKDLRKRSSAPMRASSRVELRLNGSSTPPLDDGSPGLSPAFEGTLVNPVDRLGSVRRLHSTRPPPLDLQPHQPSRPLPQAYQNHTPASHSATPRPIQPPSREPPTRPVLMSNTSSSTTVTAASSSVPGPSRSLNLRAPPSRDAGRRSPSPVNANPDAASFADRPLPPAPIPSLQSSAAEYASSYTLQQRRTDGGRATPTWASPEHQHGLPRGPAPSLAERRAAPQVVSLRSEASHRRAPSSTPTKQVSPVKAKFSAMMGRSAAAPVHPFAASRGSREEDRKTSPPQSGPSTGHEQTAHKRNPTGGFVVGPGGMLTGKSSSASTDRSRTKPQESLAATQSMLSQAQLPLEEVRRQVVKFINKEDGTTRTVAVATCASGVEVLEKVLKKFGKWNSPVHVSSETESDEDGDRLQVDGWGVYAESDPDDDAKPLSEADLLGICLSHRDGSAIREKGLVLRRKVKPANRKNMDQFLGEGAPTPMSPTSPTYHGGPRLGFTAVAEREDSLTHLTPTKAGSSKKMNRASTVSIMSGLGVPMPEQPPSPTTSRSPSSGSFLSSKGKKMYNFFGHRPPSELISNHLAEYFPSAKRKELEKTVRHSMMRVPGGRNSIAPSEGRASLDVPDARRFSVASSIKVSPPRRPRPASRAVVASPPPAATIPEETEADEVLPRLSVSGDGGKMRRPHIDGETQTDTRPPLLPPFEPSIESLSESLQAFSPTPTTTTHNIPGIPLPLRPLSIRNTRRNSGGSTRSRVSLLTQLRHNRDLSDLSDSRSTLTVDEITAKVENRRASTITFDDDDDDDEEDNEQVVIDPLAILPGPGEGLVPQDEDGFSDADESMDETDEDEDDDDDDEDEDEESLEEEDQDEHGRAFTSAGAKRSIKWIKGALIGAGSFGSVYLGMDAHSGLLMAVKQVELPTGSARNEERKRSMVSALEREIELLKELQHDNIVQYLDSSSDGNNLNIFLEYVPGGSVAALLNNYGAFEEALVRNFVRQILTGLNYLHDREIIHRDIKGANILVDNKGGIKISDFGISKKVESNLMAGIKANRPSLQGSVFWMAPEIVKQTSYTLKADIWSVGCLVVEMLTGTHPWAELNQMQAIFRIGSQARPANPSDISPEAADFLNRTFEIDHIKRPTGTDLLDHPFIAVRSSPGGISTVQAKATMAAAQKAAQSVVGGMQSLSALADLR
ncbi:hypothetical protein BCR39DRAFT_539983 [Naematelia encephala]|uniref:Protein kinase domain-containing protein n=1 Tax=Naematelia encephala TaxID=71784 RepID=A0A1Y2AWH4_9TREE|nr:hypothetical protein BCR39DRAFT_539983 [Naematelia encephala]